jgi:hypothetical protein
VGSVDAPLTPVRLTDRPKSGRSVDKRFSKGVFHSSQGGSQPGSISVPLQGWPLYEAGMDVVGTFREAMLGDYGPFEGFEKVPSSGVIECIPKLTQALLVPREVVRERRGTVDDYLFPLLPEKEGPYRRRLDQALGDYGFTFQVEEMITIFSAFSGYDEPRDQCMVWMHPCVPSRPGRNWHRKPGSTTSTGASKNSEGQV